MIRTAAGYIFCIVLALGLLLTGCGKSGSAPDTAEPEMNISFENGRMFCDGTEQRFYSVGKNQTGELKISVGTESGSLSISVFPTDDPDHFCYRGVDIPTSDFSVMLPDSGEYEVWIEAKRFAGSYGFEWITR